MNFLNNFRSYFLLYVAIFFVLSVRAQSRDMPAVPPQVSMGGTHPIPNPASSASRSPERPSQDGAVAAAVLMLKIGVPPSVGGHLLIHSAPVRPRQGRDVCLATTPGVRGIGPGAEFVQVAHSVMIEVRVGISGVAWIQAVLNLPSVEHAILISILGDAGRIRSRASGRCEIAHACENITADNARVPPVGFGGAWTIHEDVAGSGVLGGIEDGTGIPAGVRTAEERRRDETSVAFVLQPGCLHQRRKGKFPTPLKS